jgi:hypothetical protein
MRPIVGQTQTFTTELRLGNVLTDAPQITFQYKITDGNPSCEPTRSVVPSHDGTGTYSAKVTNYAAGMFYPRWDTDGLYDIAEEKPFRVYRSAHEKRNTNDYI